jgi:hypothetical protein
MSDMAQDGGGVGVNLEGHVTGDPFPTVGGSARVTGVHSWLIVVVALALLWLLGGGIFRSIRM